MQLKTLIGLTWMAVYIATPLQRTFVERGEYGELLATRYAYLHRDGTLIPPSERNFSTIEEVANRALFLANKKDGLFVPISAVIKDGQPGAQKVIWYEWASQIALDAVVSAPSSVQKQKWANEVEKLAERLLRDPKMEGGISRLRQRKQKCADSACSHDCFLAFDFTPAGLDLNRRMGSQKFHDELSKLPSQDLDYTSFATNAHGYVAAARMHLARSGLLETNNWGIQAGLKWWREREVQRKGSALFLSSHCLRELGVPVLVGVASIVIGQSTSSVKLPTSGVSLSSAFKSRIDGTVYVPILELERAGLLRIERADEAQLVKLYPGTLPVAPGAAE